MKILVVVGATGQQGRVRAVSRHPSSAQSLALVHKGVEVVHGDLKDKSTIAAAFKGAHTVFAMTSPEPTVSSKVTEVEQGKLIGDVAVAQGVELVIFSTLPHVLKISGGRYTKVGGFDAKAEAEDYIRSLPIKSAFVSPGSFMQNYHQIMLPQSDGQGGYVIARPMSPQAKLPLIETESDMGKFVGAILATPERFVSKTICAATALYTLEEQARIVSAAIGKPVKYQQISPEAFKQFVGPWGDALVEMMQYQEEFGYYGPQTESLVASAAAEVRGELTTFEEYFIRRPLLLV